MLDIYIKNFVMIVCQTSPLGIQQYTSGAIVQTTTTNRHYVQYRAALGAVYQLLYGPPPEELAKEHQHQWV